MTEQLNLLLADDDVDDRLFFDSALKKLPFSPKLNIVEDGEKLLQYLNTNPGKLPDVLFLDLNMPRKNGAECLHEIKSDGSLKGIPVIICSTSMYDDVADLLYKDGAYYYYQKSGLAELEAMLHGILTLMTAKKFTRPTRTKFMLRPFAL
ncbi:MAG: rcp1 2 [Bacteroidetes bacterium]|jgi:CheY-like chemotaxis protein|nr:rcp1 2 [Bacteroidota bacterium]